MSSPINSCIINYFINKGKYVVLISQLYLKLWIKTINIGESVVLELKGKVYYLVLMPEKVEVSVIIKRNKEVSYNSVP